jgi:hypothetical protein
MSLRAPAALDQLGAPSVWFANGSAEELLAGSGGT